MLRALWRPPIGAAAAATAAAARVTTTATVPSVRFATHPNRGGGEASPVDAKRVFDQLRSRTKKPTKESTDVFIRNAITQLKSQSAVARTEAVVAALKAVPTDDLARPPTFLTEVLNATSQREAITGGRYTPKDFRTSRLSLLSRSDLFVFVYDEHALSVSGGVELGYWLAKLENEPHGGAHTLVLLMNTMSTTLLKMLPDTTYILLDDACDPDDQVNPDHAPGVNANDFPNLITVRSIDELSGAFADVLGAMEAWSASEPPGLGLSLPKHKDQMQWMLPR